MPIIQRRRADQLTMRKKIVGREAAASAALKIRDEEQLRNCGGLCTKPKTSPDNADDADLHGSRKFNTTI